MTEFEKQRRAGLVADHMHGKSAVRRKRRIAEVFQRGGIVGSEQQLLRGNRNGMCGAWTPPRTQKQIPPDRAVEKGKQLFQFALHKSGCNVSRKLLFGFQHNDKVIALSGSKPRLPVQQIRRPVHPVQINPFTVHIIPFPFRFRKNNPII